MTGEIWPQHLVLRNMETREEYKLRRGVIQYFGSWIHLNLKEEDQNKKGVKVYTK